MNYRKPSKEKLNHLILVVVFTLLAVSGLYFGLIRRQTESIARLGQDKAAAAKKLQLVLDTLHRANLIHAELDEVKNTLERVETDIASGDLYSWVINSLRGFKASYKVEIPQFSQLGPPTDVNLFPNFPYKQATLTVAGLAHFHDLGKFLADFENQFPHTRLVNLSLDANASSVTSQPETLSFKMDIVTLVRVNAP